MENGMVDTNKFHWAGKVSRRDIKRLYASEAQGLMDVDLLEQVIFTVHVRVLDMFEVREAQQHGRVKCRACGESIPQPFWMGGVYKANPLICDHCGWQTTCGEYLASYSGKDLLPGSRTELFREFLQRFETACNPGEKMLLLDWLIHEFHVQAGVSRRLVAMNIIQGSRDELVDLITSLAGSETVQSVKAKFVARANDPVCQFRLKYSSHSKVLEVAASLGIHGRTRMREDDLIAEILHLAPELLEGD
jgi:hypothetical protein